MFLRILALFAVAVMAVQPVRAQSRLAVIKARGALACAAFERPGLARETPSGWTGVLPDFCRAVAVAALGPNARFEFKFLEPPGDDTALDVGAFDVLFLTATEIARNGLAGKVAPGPAAFFESIAVMVEKDSTAKKLDELAGASICLHEADPAAELLDHFFARKGKSFIAMPFQEDVEWRDAYNARHCRAAAAEGAELTDLRTHKGVNGFDSVILPEKLGVFAIMAATPPRDPQWSAAVARASAVFARDRDRKSPDRLDAR